MKFGCLFCAYNVEEYIEKSVSSWLHRNNVVISCVSLPFSEYKDITNQKDNTQDYLKHLKQTNQIQYLTTEPEFIPEYEARNLALKPLLEENCDWVILWDGDEICAPKEIDNLLNFLSKDHFTTWFGIHYKNLFGDGTKYVDGFCPPRAFRVYNGNYALRSVYYDNDMDYINEKGEKRSYKDFSSMKIPKNIIWPRHLTWLNNERSKQKIKYQEARWGSKNGAGCGYCWNEKNNCVEFNKEYYRKTNQIIPELIPVSPND